MVVVVAAVAADVNNENITVSLYETPQGRCT